MGLDSVLEKKPKDLFLQTVCANAVHEHGIGKWDTFWEQIKKGSEKNDRSCFVLDLFDKEVNTGLDLSAKLEVPDGEVRSVMVRFGGKVSGEISMDVVLGENSRVGLSYSGIVGKNDGLSVNVTSSQERRDSEFRNRGRIVGLSGARIEIVTDGNIGRKAVGTQRVYDTKVLKIGEVASVVGIPKIDVLCDDVVAEHGFSTGRITDEIALYMQSRGVSRKDIEELYVRGFLKGSCG